MPQTGPVRTAVGQLARADRRKLRRCARKPSDEARKRYSLARKLPDHVRKLDLLARKAFDEPRKLRRLVRKVFELARKPKRVARKPDRFARKVWREVRKAILLARKLRRLARKRPKLARKGPGEPRTLNRLAGRARDGPGPGAPDGTGILRSGRFGAGRPGGAGPLAAPSAACVGGPGRGNRLGRRSTGAGRTAGLPFGWGRRSVGPEACRPRSRAGSVRAAARSKQSWPRHCLWFRMPGGGGEMDFEWWHWIVLGFALVLAELAVPAFFVIWFGLGALLVGLALLVVALGSTAQIGLWVAASLAMVVLWFRVFKRGEYLQSRTRIGQSDGDSIGEIGLMAKAAAPFARGRVRFQKPLLGSDEWECVVDEPIAAGERVRVVSIEGSFLKVSKV